jgi:hypothetical protein
MRYFLLIILGFIALTGCSGHRNRLQVSIKDYYFPYDQFVNQQTYYYVNANDTADKSIWIMQTKIQNGDTLFLTQIQDSKNRITESLIEKINGNSSMLIGYKLFNYDNENNQTFRECKIVDSMIFKWNQNLNESIIWKVNYQDFFESNSNEFSKTRILLQVDPEKNIARFKDLFHFAMIGTNRLYEWSTESHYQKGKGLINFKVNLPNGLIRDYRLIKIKK